MTAHVCGGYVSTERTLAWFPGTTPRVRGKQTIIFPDLRVGGTTPHVRGIPILGPLVDHGLGNTPACARNSAGASHLHRV